MHPHGLLTGVTPGPANQVWLFVDAACTTTVTTSELLDHILWIVLLGILDSQGHIFSFLFNRRHRSFAIQHHHSTDSTIVRATGLCLLLRKANNHLFSALFCWHIVAPDWCGGVLFCCPRFVTELVRQTAGFHCRHTMTLLECHPFQSVVVMPHHG